MQEKIAHVQEFLKFLHKYLCIPKICCTFAAQFKISNNYGSYNI